MGDLEVYGLPRPRAADLPRVPRRLRRAGATNVLADLARRAEAGLRRIFSHCEGFDAQGDLLAWLLAHERPSAATYVNWVGRTVRQIREESALQRALAAKVLARAARIGRRCAAQCGAS